MGPATHLSAEQYRADLTEMRPEGPVDVLDRRVRGIAKPGERIELYDLAEGGWHAAEVMAVDEAWADAWRKLTVTLVRENPGVGTPQTLKRPVRRVA